MFVNIKKKRILVKNDLLYLGNMNIYNMTEIRGLEKLTELRILIIYKNRITQISHLGSLQSLEK
ncbi:MAG: hypothetical protein GF353_20535 [Candidatus Lokiarchaeota archaeon]|nr:hypothetical protein [Candidatus Lokiarchaeota archaeon]